MFSKGKDSFSLTEIREIWKYGEEKLCLMTALWMAGPNYVTVRLPGPRCKAEPPMRTRSILRTVTIMVLTSMTLLYDTFGSSPTVPGEIQALSILPKSPSGVKFFNRSKSIRMTKRFLQLIATTLVICLGATSCSDINQFHEKYVESGEYIYTSRPEVITYPGRHRIAVKIYYPGPNSATQTRVEWNNGMDSRVIDVNPAGALDSISFEIDNLEEKSYFLDLFNLDKAGNKSVKVQTTGTAYGNRYESTLNNRLLLNVSVQNVDTLVTTWSRGTKDAVYFEMKYQNRDGQLISSIIDAD